VLHFSPFQPSAASSLPKPAGHPYERAMGDGRWVRDEGATCVGRKRGSSVHTDVASGAGWVLGEGGYIRHGWEQGAQARCGRGRRALLLRGRIKPNYVSIYVRGRGRCVKWEPRRAGRPR
jgi:hypothetical protein